MRSLLVFVLFCLRLLLTQSNHSQLIAGVWRCHFRDSTKQIKGKAAFFPEKTVRVRFAFRFDSFFATVCPDGGILFTLNARDHP